MQDPNEDTEWNDVLRAKGIIGPKQKEAEITEDQIQALMDEAIQRRTNLPHSEGQRDKKINDMSLDELDELEDSEDEAVLEQYRQKRIAEMRATSEKARFGSVREISGQDYISEVTKAGEGIWVVLHLYANGVPLCALIHHHMKQLAVRFPHTKFLRSVATTCIPNFPEKNLPTIFIYHQGAMRKQFIGPLELRGDKLTVEELEFMLGQVGAVSTEITEDPKPQIRDKLLCELEDKSSEFY
ncbi:GL25063 [Drosophila persimilis]|uniref:Viral IAP-associated factor homolog n=2 Tax=pseudoobscura subgroup TaxID=32358 RepID=A0A6I8UCP1_DROPS|nr:viral IAP-associated factor homolog [Drosophila pseudoobscura]XP_002021011.1 viral IAP-associated factor homolog [Drosophila persimilis]EDW40167.1 GL25063 [Drosophila persimilis]